MNVTTTALVEIGIIVQRKIELAMRDTKLSPAQLRILIQTAGAPGISPSALAFWLLQETHSVSGLLNRLEDRDLVTRLRDRQDRRVVHVELTQAGKAMLEHALGLIAPTEDDVAEVMKSTGCNVQALRDQLLQQMMPATVRARRQLAAPAKRDALVAV